MKYLTFQEVFSSFQTVTLQDMRNVFGEPNFAQLSDWKYKGYLIPVKRGRYALRGGAIDTLLLANEMNDSYVSMESALSYYQMIPEATRSMTSVSKKAKEEITNRFGSFLYSKIAPKLYCGYTLIASTIHPERRIRIATPEKALFDLVYFRPDLCESADFDSLRLQLDGFHIKELQKFISLVEAPRIKRRLDALIHYLHAFV